MKQTLTKLCWPILRFFETGEEAVHYRKSQRVISIVVGLLFMFLSMVSAVFAIIAAQAAALIPILVFFSVGLVAIVVGGLGSDSAVAKIWGKN